MAQNLAKGAAMVGRLTMTLNVPRRSGGRGLGFKKLAERGEIFAPVLGLFAAADVEIACPGTIRMHDQSSRFSREDKADRTLEKNRLKSA